MEYLYKVTVLTPAYNRRDRLQKLYESLCKQTVGEFQWLIIDDGSTDGTEELIRGFKRHQFRMDYYKKENGGKHTALNYAHTYIEGELTVIVDSDDFLLPDAVETIMNDWKKYCMDESISGFSYLKSRNNGGYLSQKSPSDFYIDDDIHYRVNQGIQGDRCEVVRTELLKKYPFPVFMYEKFMSEGWLWTHIAYDYKTVYRNKIIYMCEYLEGGLTKSGRTLRVKSPLGMMENCKAYFVPSVKMKSQMKEMILYWAYSRYAGFSFFKTVRESGKGIVMIFTAPLGIILSAIWKKYN